MTRSETWFFDVVVDGAGKFVSVVESRYSTQTKDGRVFVPTVHC